MTGRWDDETVGRRDGNGERSTLNAQRSTFNRRPTANGRTANGKRPTTTRTSITGRAAISDPRPETRNLLGHDPNSFSLSIRPRRGHHPYHHLSTPATPEDGSALGSQLPAAADAEEQTEVVHLEAARRARHSGLDHRSGRGTSHIAAAPEPEAGVCRAGHAALGRASSRAHGQLAEHVGHGRGRIADPSLAQRCRGAAPRSAQGRFDHADHAAEGSGGSEPRVQDPPRYP